MRSRRWSSLLVVVALLVAGCSSDPGDERIDLGADGSSAEDADGEMDGSSAEDDDGSSAEETPLYPPLPPLDPDPTSDVSIEDQQTFYTLYSDYYEVVQEAFISGDTSRLATVLHGDALDGTREAIESSVTPGRAFRFPDSEVGWVTTVEVQNGPAIVQECRVFGPRSGLWDLEGDEPVEPGNRFGRLFQVRFELVDLDGTVGYRVVEILATDEDGRCHA